MLSPAMSTARGWGSSSSEASEERHMPSLGAGSDDVQKCGSLENVRAHWRRGVIARAHLVARGQALYSTETAMALIQSQNSTTYTTNEENSKTVTHSAKRRKALCGVRNS